MALSCASGLPWQGFRTRPAKVLYIGPEGFYGLIRRQLAWEQSNGVVEPVEIAYWPRAVNFYEDLATPLKALEDQQFRPDLIIIDTLQRASAGADENSVKDMGRVFGNLTSFLEKLAGERPPTCLIIHHDTKDGRNFRGSSAIFGAVDGMLSAEAKGDRQVTLTCDAFREGESFKPMQVLFHPAVYVMTEDGGQTEIAVRAQVTQEDRFEEINAMPLESIKVPQWSEDQRAVMEVLRPGGLRFNEVADATGLTKSHQRVRNALKSLAAKGVVLEPDARGGVYTLYGTMAPMTPVKVVGRVGRMMVWVVWSGPGPRTPDLPDRRLTSLVWSFRQTRPTRPNLWLNRCPVTQTRWLNRCRLTPIMVWWRLKATLYLVH
jgi:hypothetical protein